MVSLRLRIIREKNRFYSHMLALCHSCRPNGTAIYLFHDLLDKKENVKTQFAISKDSFEQFLLIKLKQGWLPLDYNTLTDMATGKKKPEQKRFIVSFDDANTSVFTKAYPFLKQNNIPFIIFITKGLVGKTNFLTEDQVKTLAADPLCTVGSHGLNHVMFRYLSKKEAEIEYCESKIYLEQLTGKSVTCFAFPYGRVVECSRQNIRTLKKSVYDFGFSAITGTLSQRCFTGKFYLPRINVDEKMVSKECHRVS